MTQNLFLVWWSLFNCPATHYEILCWNCWGLGNAQTVRDLSQLVGENRPEIIFLMETKGGSHTLNLIKIKLGFKYTFVVNSLGSKGCLAMLWRLKLGIEVINYSNHHIHLSIQGLFFGFQWFLSDFYGHLDINKKKKTWSLLSQIH